MLGSPILYLKGRRRMMFQLSGFYCRPKCQRGLGLIAYALTPQPNGEASPRSEGEAHGGGVPEATLGLRF